MDVGRFLRLVSVPGGVPMSMATAYDNPETQERAYYRGGELLYSVPRDMCEAPWSDYAANGDVANLPDELAQR